MNHFETLGVSPTSTRDEIKAAYRKLAKQWHPDLNKTAGASARFNEITRAYDYAIDNYGKPWTPAADAWKPAPRPTPQPPARKQYDPLPAGTIVYHRILDERFTSHTVTLPEDEFLPYNVAVYFMWMSQEFRVILVSGTSLPVTVKVTNTRTPQTIKFDLEAPPNV